MLKVSFSWSVVQGEITKRTKSSISNGKRRQNLVAKPIWCFSYYPSPAFSQLLQKSIEDKQVRPRVEANAEKAPMG